MNDSSSKTAALKKTAAPVATKAAAVAKPRSSESAAVKANASTRAPRTPTPAKLAPGKPVDKALATTSGTAPAKAKVKARPAAVSTAKPENAAVAVGKVRAPAKRGAKIEKPLAAVRVSAENAAKPVSDEKKSKETKHAGKKPKLVRDSFTFPAADYALIGVLKQRALKAGHEIKKSELLRAGLFALSALSDAALVKALAGIDRLKPGRPSK